MPLSYELGLLRRCRVSQHPGPKIGCFQGLGMNDLQKYHTLFHHLEKTPVLKKRQENTACMHAVVSVNGNSIAFGNTSQRGGEPLHTNSSARDFMAAVALSTWA